MTNAITPVAGLSTSVLTAGTDVPVFPENVNGGIIQNPATAPGPLYVDAVNPAGIVASNTTFSLAPGDKWYAIPGQTTITTVNATVDGQVFSAIFW